MEETNNFEILTISNGDNRERTVTFMYRNDVIGKIPLQPPKTIQGVQIHPIDYAWHSFLKSNKFQVPNTLPDELQAALTVCANEYKRGVSKENLSYKLARPTHNPVMWNFKLNEKVL